MRSRVAIALGLSGVLSLTSSTSAQEEPPLEERPVVMPRTSEEPAPPGPRVDVDTVYRRVIAARAEVQRCWVEATRGAPARRGRIEVSFWVSPAGRARDVRVVRDTLGSSAATSCVLRSVEALALPGYEGAEDHGRVSATFELSP